MTWLLVSSRAGILGVGVGVWGKRGKPSQYRMKASIFCNYETHLAGCLSYTSSVGSTSSSPVYQLYLKVYVRAGLIVLATWDVR
jgi:hypothetical protein